MRRFRIARVTQSDIDAILSIEREAFPSPWSRGMFEGELNNCFSFGYTAKIEKIVVGYIFFWVVFDEMHITNLATGKEHQNISVASHLLSLALHKSKRSQVKTAMLEVRFSNQAAISLYEKFSFRERFIRKKYYSAPSEDASVMMLDLISLPRCEQVVSA